MHQAIWTLTGFIGPSSPRGILQQKVEEGREEELKSGTAEAVLRMASTPHVEAFLVWALLEGCLPSPDLFLKSYRDKLILTSVSLSWLICNRETVLGATSLGCYTS